MNPSITQDAVNTALGTFLQSILGLPDGQVIVGQVNRVASPEGDYVVMWPLRRPRLATNFDGLADAKFTGSIAGTLMTVTAVAHGAVKIGATVFGVGVADNTIIGSQASGTPGGIGTYNVTVSQDVESRTLSTGQTATAQSTEVVMQIDVHGPASGDNAQTIQQLFRDGYSIRAFFKGTGVYPLYCDDPKQVPFITAASQFEDRWIIEAHLQITPIISVPQEYADEVKINRVPVDAFYQ
jgi:hypothetical protein